MDSRPRCVIVVLSVLLSTDILLYCCIESYLIPQLLTFSPNFLPCISLSLPFPFPALPPSFLCFGSFLCSLSSFQAHPPSSPLSFCLNFIIFKSVH
ncbi:hypothetical protein SCHPADRAFT_455433 [Schizopora paradoxa]|uniref:Uncharacterized protein n=1 Tax=Schizopora paradoxa TaxID=27342 RepID=A0A0H2RIW8_9AGAM|nr:hypothetical protein SCHPADRAFT_455433 [Schizopora paradoxa]